MSAKIELDWKVLDTLLQFKVTKKFCAEYLNVSIDVIDARILEEKKMTFSEYHVTKLERTSLKLQQKAIEMGLAGHAAMLIFALKNISGWSDKAETKLDMQPISIVFEQDETKDA